MEGSIAAQATPLLGKGDWAGALGRFQGISRKSPFAAWKWFAKANAAAEAGEEEVLEKALDRVPADFPLGRTVKILREKGAAAPRVLRREAAHGEREKALRVLKAVNDRDKGLMKAVKEFARAVYPENPAAAARFVAGVVVFNLFYKQQVAVTKVERLFPRDFARPLVLRAALFSQRSGIHFASPFSLALEYSRFLGDDFPYAENPGKVEAAVFHHLLVSVLESGFNPAMLDPADTLALKRWIGVDTEPKDMLVACAEKITRLWPDVAEYYRTVDAVYLGFLSREGKKLLERVLTRMREHFPADPYPNLRLARLYFSKGAYRKAQKVLEDAWDKAPYDPEVRESYGLGLLHAARNARRRGAYGPAAKDLQKAAELNLPSLDPAVHALVAVNGFMRERNEQNLLSYFDGIEDRVIRYRTMIYTACDLMNFKDIWSMRMAREVCQRINREIKQNLDKLSSRELGEIITPIPHDHGVLMGRIDLRQIFSGMWAKILPKVGDRKALSVYSMLLASSTRKDRELVKKDFSRRYARFPGDVFFEFYKRLIDYVFGVFPAGFGPFVRSLNPEDVKRLAEHCRSISHHFAEPLASGLYFFDLQELDMEDSEDEDFLDEDDFLEFPEASQPLQAFLEMLQEASGNRQALKSLFEVIVSALSGSSLDDDELRSLGRVLMAGAGEAMEKLREMHSGEEAEKLDRAARLILFPERN
jgi:tetratricopeptide (TPR) repeat protein